MLTRLKKEPVGTAYKQNVYEDWLSGWATNAGKLPPTGIMKPPLAVCREGRQSENYREGARIGFTLHSRGDIMDHEILDGFATPSRPALISPSASFSTGAGQRAGA
jgi:hypothetical protein